MERNNATKKGLGLVGALALLLCSGAVFAANLTIRPDGQGNYAAWANTGCSSGTSEWQCVDEPVANTSDYLQTSSNSKETFTFGNTGLVGNTINSVTLTYLAQQVNAGASCFAAMTRSGGTDFLSLVQKCTTGSFATYAQTYNVNPATNGSWNISQVDALEAGMYGLNPNNGGRVAQVYAVVDYNPFCGNNVIEGNETCDGSALGGQTCASQGFSGGTLACAAGCGGYVTSGCFTNSCSDTDGGNDPLVQGTVTGSLNGFSFNQTDFCINATKLNEYFCSGSSKFSFNSTCNGSTTMCLNGACV